jgi:hypothetical protein
MNLSLALTAILVRGFPQKLGFRADFLFINLAGKQ